MSHSTFVEKLLHELCESVLRIEILILQRKKKKVKRTSLSGLVGLLWEEIWGKLYTIVSRRFRTRNQYITFNSKLSQ